MNLFYKLKALSEALMYFAVFLLLVFAVLAIVNYNIVPFIPFLPTAAASVISPPSINSVTVHTNKAAPNDTALINKSNSTGLKFNLNKFTISFDCFLNGTYKSTDVPRVLLYFDLSSNPTSSKNITKNSFSKYNEDTPTNITIHPDKSYILSNDQTDIINVFNHTNFVVYIDSIKNDMKVVLVTRNNDNDYLEVLPTISNIPINMPFQITIVLSSNIVEIYLNKQLLFTYIIKNTRKLIIPVGPELYSLYSPIAYIGDTVKIANIQYFDNIITSSQVRTLTNTLSAPSIFS